MVRALLLTVGVGLVAACYSPPEPACGFFCGPAQACPADYHCAGDGVCHLDSTPANLGCGPDAGIDAFRFDARPDAPTPPMIVSTNPVALAIDVPVSAAISVSFDQQVVGVDASTFVVQSGGTSISGGIATGDEVTYQFMPSTSLPAASEIDVTLLSGITNADGVHFGSYFFSFNTM